MPISDLQNANLLKSRNHQCQPNPVQVWNDLEYIMNLYSFFLVIYAFKDAFVSMEEQKSLLCFLCIKEFVSCSFPSPELFQNSWA